MLRLPAAVRVTLPAYGNPDPYADIAAERPEALVEAMLTFLAQRDQRQTLSAVTLPQSTGEVGDLTYGSVIRHDRFRHRSTIFWLAP